MFLAAFSSRSREQPQSQECQRWDRSFGYNLTASRTLLGGSPGVDFHECDPGTFGLGSKRQQEVAPGNIADRRANRSFPSIFSMLRLSTAINP